MNFYEQNRQNAAVNHYELLCTSNGTLLWDRYEPET